MRYKRLLFGDVCLAENVGSPPNASVSFAFFCTNCGRVWGRLEADDAMHWGIVYNPCRSKCGKSYIRAGDPKLGISEELRLAGSFFNTHFHWWGESMAGLLLANPPLARYEAAVHANVIVSL